MRQTDVKVSVSVIAPPVTRYHTVLQLAIAPVVRIRGLEASEHCLPHLRVLGQAEAVGGGQEHWAVVIQVGDLDNHRQRPPAPGGEHCTRHLGAKMF